MWILFDTATGEQIGSMATSEPTAASGQSKCIVPQSALAVPPLTVWSSEAKGWIDDPWMMMRLRRNVLLRECDWTQIPTARLTVGKLLEWNAYRELLFNLPENTLDSFNPEWPIAPE